MTAKRLHDKRVRQTKFYGSVLATILISVSLILMGSAKEEAVAEVEPTPIVHVVTQSPQPTPEPMYDDDDVEYIARTIWGEAEWVDSFCEQSCVAWCILNRADAWGQSIEDVVTADNQFLGYRESGDCPEKFFVMATDVLARWQAEKEGHEDVGRTLPADYMWFWGDGEHNWFRNEFIGGDIWDWSYPDPYIENA